eukprot:TRINITY_DN9927_c0_g1_i1.p1 TRINITY_DN9927_c0_g1~~TRINITY_DN9927_c0_g1_i1.p1  ORF type:complete len:220 (+),score=24.22 TRINITY_DN9927_c0_g1_i1:90-662(+)
MEEKRVSNDRWKDGTDLHSKFYNDTFGVLFPEVKSDVSVLTSTVCDIQSNSVNNKRGRLYVTDSTVAFFSKLFATVYKVCIAYKDITDIQLNKSDQSKKASELIICTDSEKYILLLPYESSTAELIISKWNERSEDSSDTSSDTTQSTEIIPSIETKALKDADDSASYWTWGLFFVAVVCLGTLITRRRK